MNGEKVRTLQKNRKSKSVYHFYKSDNDGKYLYDIITTNIIIIM